MGIINCYGPKHSGNFAVTLALPTVIVVLVLIGITAPHLTTQYLERLHDNPAQLWVQFVGVILALSGVEAIANLTGVMKLDPDSTPEQPKVAREAARAIWPVAVEVVVGTALLGWAMLSINPNATVMLSDGAHSMREALHLRSEDTLRFVGEYFGTEFRPAFRSKPSVGLSASFSSSSSFSAANTAIVAMIGLIYMMARDHEMPPVFTQLNRHGVPRLPILIAVGLPVIVIITTAISPRSPVFMPSVSSERSLSISVPVRFNRSLPIKLHDRVLLGITFIILFLVEITLAHTKPDALFFVCCVLGVGSRLYALTP